MFKLPAFFQSDFTSEDQLWEFQCLALGASQQAIKRYQSVLFHLAASQPFIGPEQLTKTAQDLGLNRLLSGRSLWPTGWLDARGWADAIWNATYEDDQNPMPGPESVAQAKRALFAKRAVALWEYEIS